MNPVNFACQQTFEHSDRLLKMDFEKKSRTEEMLFLEILIRNTLWHLSTAVCKWQQLSHCKLLQFI